MCRHGTDRGHVNTQLNMMGLDNHTRMSEDEWREKQRNHHARIDVWTIPHLERRRKAIAHPVQDFMFDYYTLSPAKLRAWHPGLGITLIGDVNEWSRARAYHVSGALAAVDPASLNLPLIESTLQLLRRTHLRDPAYGCFGRHEWAMVYRQDATAVRHSRYPLRLAKEEIDAVVESAPLRCTHFDAFRFYTDAAKPLNLLSLTRANQLDVEQPGCLHATMDLYKWAYRTYPVVGADVIADAFELAQHTRAIDMRASPYDLADLGYEPIRIETAHGRATYAAYQRDITERAGVLRSQLIASLEHALTEPGW